MSPDSRGDKGAKLVSSVDRLIHEPARFNIIAYLFVVQSADSTFLQTQTGLTWGNLSSHINKLEMADYVAVEKEFVGKKPHTMLHLTDKGRVAFSDYRKKMRKALNTLPSKEI
ncbi:winged helix-turn-helix domain-containing protein [Chloroflexota bacterium]